MKNKKRVLCILIGIVLLFFLIILGIYINGYIQDRKIIPGNENLNIIPNIQTNM